MRYLLFIVSLFYASFSFSDTYSFSLGDRTFPSALEACNYALTLRPSNFRGPVELIKVPNFYNYTCVAEIYRSDIDKWDKFNIAIIYGTGNECPDPENETMNPETGTCEVPNKCAATEGMGAAHMFLANTRTNPYDPWPNLDTPPTSPYSVCRAGCRFTADLGGGDVKCGTLVGRSSLQQYCIRMYVGNGQECIAGDDPLFSGPGLGSGSGDPDADESTPPSDDPLDFPPLIDPEADPTDPSNTCGPGYAWSGTTCVKIFNEKEPTTPGSGGGSSGGGGDPGDGGDPGGDPGGNGNGDGTGTGTGTGGGGSREDKANVKGVACADERPVECSGDAYDCAIFWHTREQNCRMEEMLDYSDKQKQDISALFDGDEYNFTENDESIVELEGFINKRTRFLPSSCPPPIAIALSGRTYQLDTGPFCSFADALGYLIVAFSALAGSLYVGRAFGGE